MGWDGTTICDKETVRSELRRQKTEGGLTYDEVIERRLEEPRWMDDRYELITGPTEVRSN